MMNDELRAFNSLQAEIQGLYHEACVKLGISDSASYVLYTLAAFGEACTARDIYRNFGVSRQTIHSSILNLARKGIIYQEKGSGRDQKIYFTEPGRKYASESIEPLIRLENELFHGWPEEESQEFLRLLRKYRDDLKKRVSCLKNGDKPHDSQ